MKIQNQVLYIFIAGLLAFLNYSCTNEPGTSVEVQNSETHELECVLVDDVWRIVDREDPENREIVVSRGDTVVWYAPAERDIYFQFMTEELTGTFTQEVLSGEYLRSTVGEQAEAGEHPYAVFVHEAREYAQGQSPPVMIIRD